MHQCGAGAGRTNRGGAFSQLRQPSEQVPHFVYATGIQTITLFYYHYYHLSHNLFLWRMRVDHTIPGIQPRRDGVPEPLLARRVSAAGVSAAVAVVGRRAAGSGLGRRAGAEAMLGGDWDLPLPFGDKPGGSL